MIVVFGFVFPIAAWVINLFAASYVIEKNCLQREENPPPSVGQTIIKYIVLTAIIIAVYSGLVLLAPDYGRSMLQLTGRLGPTTPFWICGCLAATFFVWEIYRHKSIPHAHLAAAGAEIGFGGLAVAVTVWTVTMYFAISYIFRTYIWSWGVFY